MSIIATYRSRITVDAMALAKARETYPEVQPANMYIVEDIKTDYELRILREELKKVKDRIYGYEYFREPVPALVQCKLEIVEQRLATILENRKSKGAQ